MTKNWENKTYQTAIQDNRWPSEGWFDKNDYTLIYVGEANIKGRNGTGFMLDKGARKSLIVFGPVNGRISIIGIHYHNYKRIRTDE
jgi:hypothetical protein